MVWVVANTLHEALQEDPDVLVESENNDDVSLRIVDCYLGLVFKRPLYLPGTGLP